jgi:hypothetical protein
MVTADDSDRVSVWNWEHRQVNLLHFSFWFSIFLLFCFD